MIFNTCFSKQVKALCRYLVYVHLSCHRSKKMSSDEERTSEVDLNNLPSEYFLKILILGDLGVGKSSLVKKYCSSDSGPEYKVSVDVTHSCKCVNINGLKINLQLWDIPGHERFGGMTRVHYKVIFLC